MGKAQQRIIRAQMSVAHLGLLDRLRILFTGRVIVYASGVKPYCEINISTELPRRPQEREEAKAAHRHAHAAYLQSILPRFTNRGGEDTAAR